jgi:hypothetical protein
VFVSSLPAKQELKERYMLMEDDIFVKVDGTMVNRNNFSDVILGLSDKYQDEDVFVIEVKRKHKKGKLKTKKLKVKALFESYVRGRSIEPMEETTPRQQQILKAWIADVE